MDALRKAWEARKNAPPSKGVYVPGIGIVKRETNRGLIKSIAPRRSAWSRYGMDKIETVGEKQRAARKVRWISSKNLKRPLQ